MAYRLDADEAIDQSLRHIAKEQIDKMLLQLVGPTHQGPGEVVHDVRKRLKRLRALLRLIHSALGKSLYREENQYLRDVGRQLSNIRDAQVYVETVDNLKRHFAEAIAPDAFAEIRQVLESRYQAAYAELSSQTSTFTEVSNALTNFGQRIADWSLDSVDWSVFRDGLKESYQLGRQAFKSAQRDAKPECWHEWRKRVKDLWHHLQILQPIWPDFLAEMADQTKDLADSLGQDHDLAVLRQFLTESSDQFKNTTEVNALLALIDIRQTQLRTSAKLLGQRIYAEKPKAFCNRLRTYWDTWQAELHQPALVSVPGDQRVIAVANEVMV